MERHAFPVLSEPFLVDKNYEYVKELGQGAYGVVCSAKNSITGESVAIKKVSGRLGSDLPVWEGQSSSVDLTWWAGIDHQSVSEEDIDKEGVEGTQVSWRRRRRQREGDAGDELTLGWGSTGRLLHHFRGHKNVSCIGFLC